MTKDKTPLTVDLTVMGSIRDTTGTALSANGFVENVHYKLSQPKENSYVLRLQFVENLNAAQVRNSLKGIFEYTPVFLPKGFFIDMNFEKEYRRLFTAQV